MVQANSAYRPSACRFAKRRSHPTPRSRTTDCGFPIPAAKFPSIKPISEITFGGRARSPTALGSPAVFGCASASVRRAPDFEITQTDVVLIEGRGEARIRVRNGSEYAKILVEVARKDQADAVEVATAYDSNSNAASELTVAAREEGAAFVRVRGVWADGAVTEASPFKTL